MNNKWNCYLEDGEVKVYYTVDENTASKTYEILFSDLLAPGGGKRFPSACHGRLHDVLESLNKGYSADDWGGLNGLYQIVGEVLTPARQRLAGNLGDRVEAWSADEWDEAEWGAEALDLEPSDTADLIIAVYSKHDGKVVDVRDF